MWVYINYSYLAILSWAKVTVKVKSLSCARLLATPLPEAYQAPSSMGFSRQQYWSGLPLPSPILGYQFSSVQSLSHVQLLATLWTAAYQAPSSMGFFRQEYWSGVPLPSPVETLDIGL